MFGNLNTEEIETVLHTQIIGRIGCHNDNTTYIVPISYAYDGEFVYALTKEGLKINISTGRFFNLISKRGKLCGWVICSSRPPFSFCRY